MIKLQTGPMGRRNGSLTLTILALIAWMTVGLLNDTTAAPLYATSGFAPQLAEKVLATTPDGPITALDVLIYDDLNDRKLAFTDPAALLELDGLEGQWLAPLVKTVIEDLAVSEALAAQASDWQPETGYLRRAMHGVAHAVWIERSIRPQIKILPADIDRYYLANAEKFYNRQRLQVRYIWLNVPESGEAILKADELLHRIKREVEAGEQDFAAAAREYSDAPSAKDGGLLPMFLNGTYFEEFERQAYLLERPGEVSRVFYGPGGMYLLQLVEKQPTFTISVEEADAEIRDELAHTHVAPYHRWALALLREETFIRNLSYAWSYVNADAPLVTVGERDLMREDYLRDYPAPTDENYRVDAAQIYMNCLEWIDGELALQGLEKNDPAALDHPWFARARDLAALTPRAEQAAARMIPQAIYADAEAAVRELKRDKATMDLLRQCFVLEFKVDLADLKQSLPSEQRAARRKAIELDNALGQGVLAVGNDPLVLRDWYQSLNESGWEDFDGALEALNDRAAEGNWKHVELSVTSLGWLEPVPGSGWEHILAGIGRGELSKPLKIGDQTKRYYVINEKQADLDALLEKPLLVEMLLYRAEVARLHAQQLESLQTKGAIEFTF